MEIPTSFVDKARFVRVIFTDIEKEYDILLHMMTVSFDRVWRRRMFAKMDFSQGCMVPHSLWNRASYFRVMPGP